MSARRVGMPEFRRAWQATPSDFIRVRPVAPPLAGVRGKGRCQNVWGGAHSWRGDDHCATCGGARCPAQRRKERGRCSLSTPCPFHPAEAAA